MECYYRFLLLRRITSWIFKVGLIIINLVVELHERLSVEPGFRFLASLANQILPSFLDLLHMQILPFFIKLVDLFQSVVESLHFQSRWRDHVLLEVMVHKHGNASHVGLVLGVGPPLVVVDAFVLTPHLAYLIRSPIRDYRILLELPQYWLSFFVLLLHSPAELIESMTQCLVLLLVILEPLLSLPEDLVCLAVVNESLLEIESHPRVSECIGASNVSFQHQFEHILRVFHLRSLTRLSKMWNLHI